MRRLADEARIRTFMRALGRAARRPARVYLTGGATAVLSGWRASTIDIDLKLVPDDDALLRAIPELKESLEVKEGPLAFYHFDLTAQALSKIERGHEQDVEDVREMIRRGLVQPDGLRRAYAAIEPQLYRYPAVDPASFRQSLDALLKSIRR